MDFPFYPRRQGEESPVAVQLPQTRFTRRRAQSGYLPDQGLTDAVNVALLLGQPLLVTGEPGTGKTELAYHVAWSLDLGDPVRFDAKTTSAARDLFYTYDAVGRFRTEGSRKSRDFVRYEALGRAILLANRLQDVQDWLPEGFKHDGPRRSVVLIDEVDKAPRDFPNDILNEVERMSFTVPEITNKPIVAPETHTPILIITSNSEKHLPDAFLRRCVYYDIPFPEPDRLKDIVLSRFRGDAVLDDAFLAEALDFFGRLRDQKLGLRKRPATAELLGWLEYLVKRIGGSPRSLRGYSTELQGSLGALMKDADDQRIAAKKVVPEWLSSGG